MLRRSAIWGPHSFGVNQWILLNHAIAPCLLGDEKSSFYPIWTFKGEKKNHETPGVLRRKKKHVKNEGTPVESQSKFREVCFDIYQFLFKTSLKSLAKKKQKNVCFPSKMSHMEICTAQRSQENRLKGLTEMEITHLLSHFGPWNKSLNGLFFLLNM